MAERVEVVPYEARTAVAQPVGMTPMEMIQTALSNGAGIEMIDKLMSLQERWEANLGRKAFDQAIAAAKAEIPPILKNRTVDFTSQKGRTHYKHEDLAQIASVVDPILGKYGLSYRYRTAQTGEQVTVTCVVSHRDGYSEETSLTAAADNSGNKNSIQAVGSAITFLQRYTLKAALGLAAAHDDDAGAAGRRASGGSISEEQFIALRDLIEQTAADEARFLSHFGINHIGELPLARFGEADGLLRRKQKGAPNA